MIYDEILLLLLLSPGWGFIFASFSTPTEKGGKTVNEKENVETSNEIKIICFSPRVPFKCKIVVFYLSISRHAHHIRYGNLKQRMEVDKVSFKVISRDFY